MNALQILVANAVNVLFVILECIAISELFLETSKNQKKRRFGYITLSLCSVIATMDEGTLKIIALSAMVMIIVELIYEGEIIRKVSVIIGILGAYYMAEIPFNYMVRLILGIEQEMMYSEIFIGRIISGVTIILIGRLLKKKGLLPQLKYLNEREQAQYVAAVKAIGFYERMSEVKQEREEVETYLYEQLEGIKSLITEGKTDEILKILREIKEENIN